MSITNLAFVVPGEPVGKQRARSTANGHHYTPPKTANYEALVALAAQAAMGPEKPFSGPLAVEIESIHTIPASWSKKRRNDALQGTVWPTVSPDIDNIAKAIFDGGNAVAWDDDRQIVHLSIWQRYGERPEVRVRVAALGVSAP